MAEDKINQAGIASFAESEILADIGIKPYPIINE